MGRFSYVQYDEESVKLQKQVLQVVDDLRAQIETNFKPTRESALALTRLEECWMWIGKAIKIDQEKRQTAGIGDTRG